MADPEIEAAAGEYVLGTLDAEERRAFLRRLAREPETAAAVAAWQQRLAPLSLALPETPPPAALLARIERALDGTPVAANDNRLALWRVATAAALALAAVGLGLASRRPRVVTVAAPAAVRLQPVALRPQAIAALSSQGVTPMLFVMWDKASGKVEVLPVGIGRDAAHAIELWLIQGKSAPRPVGIVQPGQAAHLNLPAAPAEDAVFAISREPRGGSPTGLPTGPVLATGPLVAL